LYEATFEVRWLEESRVLTDEMIRLFWDDENGGVWFSGTHNESLIARTKELYDGALPSGNSVAVLNLSRLAILTTEDRFREKNEQLIQAFSGQVQAGPSGFSQFLIGLDLTVGPSREVVIAGDRDAEDTLGMIGIANKRFLPRSLLVLHPSGNTAGAIEKLAPFIASQLPLNNQATAYVCQNYVCHLPVTDHQKFADLLDKSAD